jgi:hypothetical protein
VRAEPGNEMAAAAAGRGHFRASHADREQVIAVLKAAFVQGRLTKDELDARVGQTFASRTYADLAAVTFDLPRGLITAPPPRKAARARARPPLGKVAAGAALIGLPPIMVAATFLTGSEPLAFASAMVVVFFFMAWMVAGAQMLANWHDKRSRGQLPPPRRTRRGRALEGQQDGGIGGDLLLCEARRDARARRVTGHGATQRAWRSPAGAPGSPPTCGPAGDGVTGEPPQLLGRHAAQSRTGARERANDEGGSSRSAVLRTFIIAGDAHWAAAPIRRERRVIIWVRGRRCRS